MYFVLPRSEEHATPPPPLPKGHQIMFVSFNRAAKSSRVRVPETTVNSGRYSGFRVHALPQGPVTPVDRSTLYRNVWPTS
jgi:hypothetical protein